jgi:hypothetical protein
MSRHVLPFLLLVVVGALLLAYVPSRDATRLDTQELINIATLSPSQAARLEGRRCAFRIEVHPTAPIETDFPGQTVCECVHGGDPDLKWEAILPDDSTVKRGAKLVVEGTVRVIHYSDSGLLSGLTIVADKVRRRMTQAK